VTGCDRTLPLSRGKPECNLGGETFPYGGISMKYRKENNTLWEMIADAEQREAKRKDAVHK